MSRPAKPFVVAVVADQRDLRSLSPVLPQPHERVDQVELALVSLTLDTDEVPSDYPFDPIVEIVRKLRSLGPDVIFIGQTDRAEEILMRLRVLPSPLVVRWSSYYGKDGPVHTEKRPEGAGYHIDMPKKPDSLCPFLADPGVVEAVRSRDDARLRRLLPESARLFSALQGWSTGKSTPILDLPDMIYFMYLDEAGIDTLFGQTAKRHVESVTCKRMVGTKGRAAGKITLGRVLELLGLGTAEVSADVSRDKTDSVEFIERLDTVAKLRIIQDSLIESSSLRVVRLGRNTCLKRCASACFVDFLGWFRVKDDLSDILLLCGSEDRFLEFECTTGFVRLGASTSKFKTGLHHVAGQFRDGEVELRIFGQMTPLQSGYYLKPFAFWQTRGGTMVKRGS